MKYKYRCSLSREGLDIFSKQKNWKNRQGWIVGESQDKKCWRVQWDGQKSIQALHKSFIWQGIKNDTLKNVI